MMRQFLYSLFVAACLSLSLWARPVTTVTSGVNAATRPGVATMPKQCKPGKTSPEALGWRWRPGTLVRVYYLRNNFSETEREALTRSVNGWNNALRGIGSSIVLTVGGERDGVAQNNASITVMRGIPRGRERVGEIKYYSLSNGVVRMTVTIGPAVTDPSALTSLMTHELGHSLGLADCYECRRGTTAMAAFRSDNRGNDVYEPSECDIFVVASAYASETGAQANIIPIEQR